MDTAILKKKISILQEYLSKCLSYAALRTDELLNNEEKRVAMERWFQLLVDEALDINAFLAYQLHGKVAESYKSTFYELISLGILEHAFADQIAESAKVRNQLTHEYEKISHAETIEAMKKYITLYQTYTRILIEKFIQSK